MSRTAQLINLAEYRAHRERQRAARAALTLYTPPLFWLACGVAFWRLMSTAVTRK